MVIFALRNSLSTNLKAREKNILAKNITPVQGKELDK